MATVMELVNSLDQNSKQYDEFLRDLSLFDNDIPFKTEEINKLQNVFITTVNARLNQECTRYNGLVILDYILSKCSKHTLSKYGIFWITKATQVLENVHSNPKHMTIACKIIASLLSQSKEIPEVLKQISMHHVKQLINVIGNIEPNVKCGAIYYLIATLLYHFPEVCERFQVSIRKMILNQIDSTQKHLINAGAKCYVLLSKATERSFKPLPGRSIYTGWLYSEVLLCNSLHVIMDELLSDVIELEKVEIWSELELQPISKKNVIAFYFGQKQRFVNLCTYLCAMLQGYEAKNSVLPTDILQVLCRGLAVTPVNLGNQDSFKGQMLYLILPQLHIALLNVLNALIYGFRQELIAYGSVILQLLYQTLKWTGNIIENHNTISRSKPFKNVRISVYKCMSTWLMFINSSSGIETLADECLIYILKDVMPEKHCVSLTVQKIEHLSKRAMKRHRESQYNQNSSLNNTAPTNTFCLNADICKEALITLQNIFSSGLIGLKQSFFKVVQNIMVSLLYDIYLNTSQNNFYKDNIQCRLELLRTLRKLEMNPHSITPPPTHYSVQLFEMALTDNDVNIIQEAKLALSELEKIVHPVAPTLNLTRLEEAMDEEADDSNIESTLDRIEEIQINGSSCENSVPHCTKRQKMELSMRESLEELSEQGSNNINVSINNGNQSLSKNYSNLYDECESESTTLEKDVSTNEEKNMHIDNVMHDSNSSVTCDGNAETCTVLEEKEMNGLEEKENEGQSGIQNQTNPTDSSQNCAETFDKRMSHSELISDTNANSSTQDVHTSVEDSKESEEILRLFCDEPKDN